MAGRQLLSMQPRRCLLTIFAWCRWLRPQKQMRRPVRSMQKLRTGLTLVLMTLAMPMNLTTPQV